MVDAVSVAVVDSLRNAALLPKQRKMIVKPENFGGVK